MRRAVAPLALLVSLACGRAEPANESGGHAGAATAAPAAAPEGPAAARVTLAPGEAQRIGLSVAPAAADRSSGEREAYGRVLDPAPLFDQLARRETARAALAQARSEYARVRALGRLDGNASVREIESAELALRRGEIESSAAQERLRSTWGDALADRGDLVALAGRLGERSAAVARVEVPAGDPAAGTPSLALLSLATTGAPAAAAMLLGSAPATDPLTQGQGFLVLIEQEPPPPGSALVARLQFPEQVRAGVRVEASAIVWSDGRPQVWVERGNDTYERRPVTIEEHAGADAVVTGIEPGDRVVVSGAEELLSNELLSGNVGE